MRYDNFGFLQPPNRQTGIKLQMTTLGLNGASPDWTKLESIGRNGHHSIFEEFNRTNPRSDDRYDYNFMGACIAHEFERDLIESNPQFDRATAKGLKSSGRSAIYDDDPTYPYKQSEDYFEWIDLLTSIDRSDTQFTMLELGAGYGRWVANAAAALKRHKTKRLRAKLIGIESDQMRFDMMVKNCEHNGIAQNELQLIRAACTADGNAALMSIGEDYGNHVWNDPKIAIHFQDKEVDRLQFADGIGRRFQVQKVPGIRLQSLVSETVDFIDMDIQGAEEGVIFSCIDSLDERVKMIHVGTHSLAIDSRLCHLFHLHGWRPRRIFSHGSLNRTPYGEFRFIDGIQSWENPRFG
jgi:FkbM family methyltransferase